MKALCSTTFTGCGHCHVHGCNNTVSYVPVDSVVASDLEWAYIAAGRWGPVVGRNTHRVRLTLTCSQHVTLAVTCTTVVTCCEASTKAGRTLRMAYVVYINCNSPGVSMKTSIHHEIRCKHHCKRYNYKYTGTYTFVHGVSQQSQYNRLVMYQVTCLTFHCFIGYIRNKCTVRHVQILAIGKN